MDHNSRTAKIDSLLRLAADSAASDHEALLAAELAEKFARGAGAGASVARARNLQARARARLAWAQTMAEDPELRAELAAR